jgi:hypothetical protein
VTGPDDTSDRHAPAPAADPFPATEDARGIRDATPRRVDPEDWAASPTDDDERYERERPPHWE